MPTDSAAWKRLRQFILARWPVCGMCSAAPATDVDHRNGRADRREDYAHDNLWGLCRSCHSRKTLAERNGGALKGCDADGTPLAQKGPRAWG